MQTQFLYYFGKVRCLRPVPKKPAWEFHYLTNPLHLMKHTRTTLHLCSNALQQETHSLLAIFHKYEEEEEMISLERDICYNEALNSLLNNTSV